MTLTDDRSHQVLEPEPAVPTQRRFGARTWLLAIAAVAVVVVLLAFLVGGSATKTNVNSTSDSAGSTLSGPTVGGSAGGSAKSAASGAHSNAAPAIPAPVPADAQQAAPHTPAVPVDTVNKIVKTGEMDLAVDKGQVAHTIDRLIALAALERGFVADSHSSEGVSPSGSVSLRVPVQSFEATVTQVRGLPKTKVVSQQTAGEDVTNKYVDLQARLRSLVATRSTYERLLAQAGTIADTLAVQARITDVQTQIEQLQGELRVLNDQTTFGTLTVTVDEGSTKAAPVHHRSGMSKAFHRSLDRFVNGIEAIVGILGPLLLVVLLIGLALGIGSVVYRRLRRQLA